MGRFRTRFVEEFLAVVVLFQVGCSRSPATFTLTDSGKVVSAMLGDELRCPCICHAASGHAEQDKPTWSSCHIP
jgi:hypothetical protein